MMFKERTDDEILTQIENVKETDFFGFITSDLLSFLPFEKVKPFLKEGTQEQDWHTNQKRDRDALIDEITGYMEFAWDKANSRRGLSAGRSLNHMQAWLWMLGEDEASRDLNSYCYYGKPQLAAICEKYDIDWKALDDGHWGNHKDHEEDIPASEIKPATLTWKVERPK